MARTGAHGATASVLDGPIATFARRGDPSPPTADSELDVEEAFVEGAVFHALPSRSGF